MPRMASARLGRFTAGLARVIPAGCAALILVIGLLLAAPAGAQPTGSADVQFFRIGSGVVDSPSFALAGIVAAGISSPPGARPCDRGGSCGVPGMVALAQALGSAAEAIDMLEQRQIDAIVVPAGDAYRAYSAKRPDNAKPREGLRTVATLFVQPVHAVVREGSRYETVDDLKRHNVAGATDDPSAVSFVQLYMGHLGLETGKKPTPPVAIQAGLQRLADNRLDGIIVVAAAPNPTLVEFGHTVPIRLLAVPAAASTRLPYLADIKLPAATYASLDAIELPGLPTQLMVPAGADANRVEAITRALWNDATQKLLAAGPPFARAVKLERALAGVAVPLHPGAARFYREAGVLKSTPVGE